MMIKQTSGQSRSPRIDIYESVIEEFWLFGRKRRWPESFTSELEGKVCAASQLVLWWQLNQVLYLDKETYMDHYWSDSGYGGSVTDVV